ncbi:MAG: efflux RND transporter periplasmic adaptor subunit [Lachnospiraceae bacterium]|nr:efflux RND transporter periplasmic adaptor subunit [Lachnospiraceae bacterium]MDY4068578.1 efflux RND transporter periplasmic adaptor subunit [Lachnospiraceae bacterium]
MRDKESVKAPDKKRKKRIALMVAAAIIVAAGAVSGYLYWRSTLTTETPQTPFPPRDGENVVSATGTTSTGLIEKEIALDFLDADLIVEDVYVSSADEVESGTAVLRLTDNSYKEAYRELERALMEAELAYRQGEIDYENKKLEAENEQKHSQIASDFAQIVYDDTLMEAQIVVQRTEQEVVDAQEIVDEYIDGIENDAYREEYEVDEKKAAYERNVALFFEKLDDYGYELDDDDDDDPNTYNIVQKGSTGSTGAAGSSGSGDSSTSQSGEGESTVLAMLKAEYQENKEEYDDAVKDYEAALAQAKAGLAQAQDTLELKQLALEEAQMDYEKKKAVADADYEKAVLGGQKAQTVYQTTIKRQEEALEVLSDALEDARDNMESFEEIFPDGCAYTEGAGTVLMIRAMKGMELEKEGILFAYSDASVMNVNASVDQSVISQIQVGEEAAIVMEDYDTCTGIVKSINPISESTSRSSVTYNVVLEIQGDISELSANVTANVYFGMDAQAYEERRNENKENREKRQNMDGGDMPAPPADGSGVHGMPEAGRE